jgi:glycosyltransferase involved in cell wall biosynthesis
MTADTLGGVWTYALELILALNQRGVEVGLATMGRRMSREQRNAVRGLPLCEVFESAYRLEWMEDPWADIHEAAEWLRNLERDLRPELIHFNHFAHAALNWNVPTLLVAHSDVYSWWQAVHREQPPSSWKKYHELVRSALHRARFVVAPSHAALRDLIRNFGNPKNVRVIRNGRDAFINSEESSPRRSKRNKVLTIGRVWDEAKNIRILDEVAPELAWPIEVAGEFASPEGTPRQFTHLNALGFLPPEEIQKRLCEASIYALPALYEPFGLSVLEAAAAGCALVLGDLSSLRENWEGAAIFVDPRNPASVREGLRAVIRGEKLRNELGRLASERARSFDPQTMLDGYLEIYRDLRVPNSTAFDNFHNRSRNSLENGADPGAA